MGAPSPTGGWFAHARGAALPHLTGAVRQLRPERLHRLVGGVGGAGAAALRLCVLGHLLNR